MHHFKRFHIFQDKRLHAFGHDSVRKSNLGKSIEMWVPLSNTPEPTERCQTRIMARATTGVDAPRVDSDSDAGGEAKHRFKSSHCCLLLSNIFALLNRYDGQEFCCTA